MPSKSLPSVDVVIPCYNEHDAISRCIDTLMKQKKDINKIILVDNNSTDDTAKIIKKYKKIYPNTIEYYFEPKQGVQYARNLGFDSASADIIARIDADVQVQPGWVSAIRHGYSQNPDYMATSGVVDYYDLPFRWFMKVITWVFIFAANALFTGKNTLYGSNMAIRRTAWSEIRNDILMDDEIMEDTAISLALNRANLHTGHINDAYVSASGRRLRNTPTYFWKYNRLWWRTYKKSGHRFTALGVRVIVWFCNALQALCWVVLLLHDPDTGKWGIRHKSSDSSQDRILP